MESKTGNGNHMTLQKLVDDLKVVIADGEQLMKGGAGQLREQAKARLQATDEQIRKRPYTSLGVVFGLGLVLGIVAYNLVSHGAKGYQEEYN